MRRGPARPTDAELRDFLRMLIENGDARARAMFVELRRRAGLEDEPESPGRSGEAVLRALHTGEPVAESDLWPLWSFSLSLAFPGADPGPLGPGRLALVSFCRAEHARDARSAALYVARAVRFWRDRGRDGRWPGIHGPPTLRLLLSGRMIRAYAAGEFSDAGG